MIVKFKKLYFWNFKLFLFVVWVIEEFYRCYEYFLIYSWFWEYDFNEDEWFIWFWIVWRWFKFVLYEMDWKR